MVFKKLFASKNTSFAVDSLVLTFSKILAGVVQIIVTMILSKYRSLQEYGTFTQMLLVVNLINSVLMMGLPNSISFFLGRSKELKSRQDFLSVYYTLNTILTFLSGAILLACIVPIQTYFKNDSIGSYWYFLAFFPWATVTSSAMENMCVSSQKTNFLIPFKIFHSISSILVALLCYLCKAPFQIYVVGYLASEGVFALLTYIFSFFLAKQIRFSLNKNILKSIFAFSIPIGIASAIGTLNAEIDKFMIGWFLSTEQVAIYSNAAKDLPLTVFAISMTAALLPRLSKILKDRKYEEGTQMWGKAIVISLSIIALFSLGCFTFAEDVVMFLYGDKYLSGVGVFRIFSILLLFRCTYWGMILNASGNTKFILYSSLAALIVNIFLNFAFFKLFGMIGCAISSFISTVSISFAQLFYTCKITKISFKCLLPWKKMMIIVVVNCTLAIVFFRVKELFLLDKIVGSFYESLILGCCWVILYIPLLHYLRIINLKSLFKKGFAR